MAEFEDITERKRVTQELKRMRAYLQNIVNSMPSILVGVDSEGNVTQWNSQAHVATGLAAVEAVGQPLAQAFPHLAPEMERMCALGRIGPELWMKQAVNSKISTQPLIQAAQRAAKVVGSKKQKSKP